MAGTPERLVPSAYEVRDIWPETADVFTLVLEPTDGAAPAQGAPGQFNMLWAFGVGEAPISTAKIVLVIVAALAALGLLAAVL